MARWNRQILFGDVDAMYASAAIVANPRLAKTLIAVGSPPPRGIITAASYPVRSYGVHAAMPTAHALRLCPQLTVVPPDVSLYARLHRKMETTTQQLLPSTCWTSIDEFYADVTDLQTLYPSPFRLGQQVKNALFEATGLRTTIALATGPIIAKMAANAHKPNGLAVIEPGTESAFLLSKPIEAVPGIGPKTAESLNARGIRYLRDLLDERFVHELKPLLGSRLFQLQALAQGSDSDPVPAYRTPKSIGHETTFDHDTTDCGLLEQTVHGFLSTLAHELRREGLEAGGFTLKAKDSALTLTTRHRRFHHATNHDPTMWQSIRPALYQLVLPNIQYRLIGLSLSDLVPVTSRLFDQKTTEALAAMDRIIAKHGPSVIRWGETPEK